MSMKTVFMYAALLVIGFYVGKNKPSLLPSVAGF